MASTKIKVAIAGAGTVTRHHLLAGSRLAQVEVVAICARHLDNAENRAAEFNLATAYDDVNAMLDRRKVQHPV